MPGAINAFGVTLFKGVTNVTGVLIAIALLTVGVILLVVSSNGTKKALSIAANVVPGGTVVKSAVKGAVKV